MIRKLTEYEVLMAIAMGKKIYKLAEVINTNILVISAIKAEDFVMDEREAEELDAEIQKVAEACRSRKEPDKPEKPEGPEEPEKKEKQQETRKKIDWGKVKALRRAGWSVQEIAREVDGTEGTIRNGLTRMKKQTTTEGQE